MVWIVCKSYFVGFCFVLRRLLFYIQARRNLTILGRYIFLILLTALTVTKFNYNHELQYRILQLVSEENGDNFFPGKIGELCTEDSGGEKQIFFLETSGEECLRPRQACAIESAAITNPDFTIYLYMALSPPPGKPEADKGDGLGRNCKTMELLRQLPNVQVIREDLKKHLIGTPIESLYLKGQLNYSEYSLQHMSDAVRIALLHKLGGIYIDLDVVVLRSLRCLRNTAGQVFILGQSSIENGFLAFDRGHKLLSFFMRLMKQTYKPNERSVIGPGGFTKAFRLLCNHNSIIINDTIHDYSCHDGVQVKIFNKTAFNPITYFEQSRFFTEGFPRCELSMFDHSYSVHVYGSGHGAHVPENSLFAFMAKRFCPAVYQEHLLGTYVF